MWPKKQSSTRRVMSISNKTRILAKDTKEYLEKKYSNIKRESVKRNARRSSLEERLNNLDISTTSKEELRSKLKHLEAEDMKEKLKVVKYSDFRILKVIGKGSFGTVNLVQYEDCYKLLAMKVLKKSIMMLHKQISHVKSEQNALSEATELTDTSHLVKLHYSFQDNQYLYLVMDYLPGGDLMNLLIRRNILSEEEVKYYSIEILKGIETIHQMGYIHRDIKPDNILIDWDGHVKLADFGLCKKVDDFHDIDIEVVDDNRKESCSNKQDIISIWKKKRRNMAFSTVGTPNYICPEILLKKGYGKEVDYWSLGIILFECAVGYPPFCAENTQDTCRKILRWKDTFRLPSGNPTLISKHFFSLLKRLICEPCVRLGVNNGINDFKNHPWFNNTNFEDIAKAKPPFVPIFSNQQDELVTRICSQKPPQKEDLDKVTQYFDDYSEEKEKLRSTPGGERRRYAVGKNRFLGFTYKSVESKSEIFLKSLPNK